MSKEDIWSKWILESRFGGDPAQLQAMLKALGPVRDKLLLHANLTEGETLLDVGCGDGFVGFGALRHTATGAAIFCDISQPLLDQARRIASDSHVLQRCPFLLASAEDLTGIPDASVDAVTLRSVLIYVKQKEAAFREFHRVLRPNGRLSIFEPVNSFRYPEPVGIFGGISVGPVADIAEKVKQLYFRMQPPEDPLLDIDERKLLDLAEYSGFKCIQVEFHAELKPLGQIPDEDMPDWDTLMRTAPNPKVPTLNEAMQQVLTPAEIEALTSYVRPLYEAKHGTQASAVAYLFATK